MESLNNQIMEVSQLWPLIKEVIDSGGEYRLHPRGISMLPLIRPGQDTVSLVLPNEINEGDIVLYQREEGHFVLHRVMYIKDSEYQMCGDNQDYLEFGIKIEQIVAKVKNIYKDNEQIVNTESKEYKKYVKSIYKKIKKRKRRVFFASLKNKILRRNKKGLSH